MTAVKVKRFSRFGPANRSAAVKLGYDAVKADGTRRPPTNVDGSEDAILPSASRKRLTATLRDVLRNYATAGWMIRCHLDYICRFTLQVKTDNDDLNAQVESLIEADSRPGAFEVSGRYSRDKALRITEARRVLDGDAFWAKLSSGRVQIIEGDRIRTADPPAETGWKAEDFTDGVAVTPGNRLSAVMVCKRGTGGKGYEFERIIPARNIWQHAYWDTTFRVDQVRGISPIAPGLNTLQDISEGVNLAMAKAKVAQMFGLVITRKAIGEQEGWAPTQSAVVPPETGEEGDGGEGDGEEDAAPEKRYDVDPGRGPFKLEMQDNDDAKFLTTNTPESELLNFLMFCTDLTLKVLDIPYSFYDSSKVNYYGQKADILKYENSCRSKREDNRSLLEAWTRWRLILHVIDGTLVLPEGMRVEDIPIEWVPAGMPWLDKLKDLKGDTLAIDRNLDSEIRVARRGGNDAYEIARERMDYEEWIMKERSRRNLPPITPQSPAPDTADPGNTEAIAEAVSEHLMAAMAERN